MAACSGGRWWMAPTKSTPGGTLGAFWQHNKGGFRLPPPDILGTRLPERVEKYFLLFTLAYLFIGIVWEHSSGIIKDMFPSTVSSCFLTRKVSPARKSLRRN